MSRRWVCIGHSHAAALASAARRFRVPIDVINFWETGEPWRREGGTVALRPDLAERVGRGDVVLSTVGGSAHSVLGTVEHYRPFDFVLPSDPRLPLDEDREIIPAAAVRATLAELANPYLETLPALRAASRGAVVQLEPPPPVVGAERAAMYVNWEDFPGYPRRIAPKWVRFKLWRLHCEIIRAECDQLDIVYSPSPPSARDAEGFLDEKFSRDGAHGNAAYGALVLESARQAA